VSELATNKEGGKVLTALIALQAELKPLKVNAESHHGKFVNLRGVMETLQPLLTKHKLAVIQIPASSASGSCTLITRVIHDEDRSEISSTITIPMQRQNDPQEYGKAMTYGRRYALMCMFGLVTEDDDAAGASMTLDKLLREVVSCTSVDELSKLRGEHADKGYLNDKFTSKIYGVINQKMHDAFVNQS